MFFIRILQYLHFCHRELLGMEESHGDQPITQLRIRGARRQTQRCDGKSSILSTSGVKGGGPDCSAVTGPQVAALPERELWVNFGRLADELGLGLQGEGQMLKGCK